MISIIPQPLELTPHEGALTLTLPLRIARPKDSTLATYLTTRLGKSIKLLDAEKDAQIIFKAADRSSEPGAEGYTLTCKDTITITAVTEAGLFYGLQTLLQLLPPNLDQMKAGDTVSIPHLHITDRPQYAWRGFMLDEARHFFGMDTVKRVLDWLALLKVNVFHWHLTDYQGWRIEIKKYPLLTEIGSKRTASQRGTFFKKNATMDNTPHGGFYTQEQIKEIVAYAAERHITILPEFDLPGHFTAVLAGYPQFGCTKQPYEVRTEWGIFDDVACVGSTETRTFIKDVLDEFAALFPGDHIHLGGDEVKTTHWETCPDCQRVMKEAGLHEVHDLNGYLMSDLSAHLKTRGKTAVVWNEALSPALNKDVVVMHWKPGKQSMQSSLQGLADGYKVIFQTFFESYFDYPYTMTTLKSAHQAPAMMKVTPQMAPNVLGVQGALWTEFVMDEARIQWMAFPRMAARAEVGWAPAHNRDYSSFQQRWKTLTPHFESLGLTNPAVPRVWNPNKITRAINTFRDLRKDMHREQRVNQPHK